MIVMSVFDKVRLPLGIGRKNKFSMRPITTTTQDWFSLRPVFSVEMMPNSSIRVGHSYYSRLSPLQKPMMGTGRIINRAFFVPYRILMPGFNDFISDTDSVHNGSSVRYSHVPYVKQSVLCDAIVNSGGVVAATSSDYDFAYYVSGTLTYGKFNEKGKQIYAILTGLGYSLSFGFQSEDDPANMSVSLMKLLAYFKIVSDWYVNNNFFSRANNINVQLDSIGRTLSVTTGQLTSLFMLTCYSTLDEDYFTTASVNPVTPPGSSQVLINDITNDKTNVGSSSSTGYRSGVSSLSNPSANAPSTPTIKGVNADGNIVTNAFVGNLSQYLVNALAALTSYMQRNNIVGYKTLDRFRARFGIKLDSAVLDRSIYLGSNSSSIKIDEVMSNADTEGAALGAYVGRGEAGDRNNVFSFKNEAGKGEFGVFMILSTIIPDIHYGQGISRDNLHINRLDFFTPEFDALGMQAIARAELYNDAKTIANLADLRNFSPNDSFGFQATYSEYCRIPDILSGDFRRNNSLDLRAFHLYRMFNEPGVDGSPSISSYTKISENFVMGNPSEYNKIFNYLGTDWDHFYVVHVFDVDLVQPKKRLYDSYEFHDDNEGEPVTMDYKGTKLE